MRLLPAFGIEFGNICGRLVHVVCDLYAKTPSFVLDIKLWDKLPAWFFEQGIDWFSEDDNKRLGIQLAHAFSEAEPWNPVYYVDLSTADQADERPIDNDRAIFSLNGLASAFADLFDETADPLFIEGCACAVQLGFTHIDRVHSQVVSDGLKKGKRKCDEEGISSQNRPPVDAFETLEEGILEVYEQCSNALPKVIQGKELTFRKLANRLGIPYS